MLKIAIAITVMISVARFESLISPLRTKAFVIMRKGKAMAIPIKSEAVRSPAFNMTETFTKKTNGIIKFNVPNICDSVKPFDAK